MRTGIRIGSVVLVGLFASTAVADPAKQPKAADAEPADEACSAEDAGATPASAKTADADIADPFSVRNPVHDDASPNPDAIVFGPVLAPHTMDACDCISDPGKPRRNAAKLVLAGGAALLTASFLVSVWAEHGYTNEVRRIDGSVVDPDRANHYVDVARYGGTSLFFAGAAAVGAAAYLYFTAPTEIHRTIVTPAISNGQAGVSLLRSF